MKILPSERTDFKISTLAIVIWFVCLETSALSDYFLPLPITLQKYKGDFRKTSFQLWITNLAIPHGDFSA
jgi:hypothetical protein